MKIIRILILTLIPLICGFMLAIESNVNPILAGFLIAWTSFIGFYVAIIGENN